MKMPTTPTTADGLIKPWIDEELIYTLQNIRRKGNGGTNTWTNLRYYPSERADVSYGHYLDEVVYSGYVPPSGTADTTPPQPPTNVRVL